MKTIKVISILLITFVLVSCSSNTLKDDNPKEYQDYVTEFQKINLDELNEKIDNNDSFYLYIGKESCSYCQIFVPKLYDASKKSDVTIYYWDVENLAKDDQTNSFLEKYQIEYTPTLLKFNKDKTFDNIEFDSEKINSEELQDLLKEK